LVLLRNFNAGFNNYNESRPHMALGNLPSLEYIRAQAGLKEITYVHTTLRPAASCRRCILTYLPTKFGLWAWKLPEASATRVSCDGRSQSDRLRSFSLVRTFSRSRALASSSNQGRISKRLRRLTLLSKDTPWFSKPGV
jgi:hypothetical protein